MSEISASIKTEQQGPEALKFIFSITKTGGDGGCSKQSNEYTIGNLACVRFKFVIEENYCYTMEIKVSTMKYQLEEDSPVTMYVTCANVNNSVPESWFCSNSWVEKHLGQKAYDSYGSGSANSNIYSYRFEVMIIAKKMVLLTPQIFYNDKTLTDFHLTAADGSVAVHKIVLATHSDMFKTMLGGEWKETAEGRIELKGVSLQTLQHLKDYMYLGTLPDAGLQALLLLAKRYLIEHLEKDCTLKLAQTVKPEDLLDLLGFAWENQIPKLTFAVLRHTSVATVESANKLLEEMQISKAEDKE